MEKVREIIFYKNYFDEFYSQQSDKVKTKIVKILDIIEQFEYIPSLYLKYLSGTNGLYEIRVQVGSNIFRIFCFFEGNKLVVLLSGFQKKTTKTPKRELDRAVRLMKQYFLEKNNYGTN